MRKFDSNGLQLAEFQATLFEKSVNIRQMSGQVSRGSAGEYQADEQAAVPWLHWRVSGR